MRAIRKGTEPRSLTEHRKQPHADYDNYAYKDDLRRALVTEQRGLCCYCMCRIHNGRNTMKIEHWHCQSRYPSEQLDYQNLLGACLGGEGQPMALQHCDTRKGDRDLKWNPADLSHNIETQIYYELDGSVRSKDHDFDVQLNDVLNLNLPVLKNNRKQVLDAVLIWWKQERARIKGQVSRRAFERQRDRRIQGTGELEPFCQIAVWWLEQRLDRMQP